MGWTIVANGQVIPGQAHWQAVRRRPGRSRWSPAHWQAAIVLSTHCREVIVIQGAEGTAAALAPQRWPPRRPPSSQRNRSHPDQRNQCVLRVNLDVIDIVINEFRGVIQRLVKGAAPMEERLAPLGS